jgi:hypothetical protein
VTATAHASALPEHAEAVPSPLTGPECGGCANLEMHSERFEGTRQQFWWRCRLGHELLEVRFYGSRVTVAPAECVSFVQWTPGTP